MIVFGLAFFLTASCLFFLLVLIFVLQYTLLLREGLKTVPSPQCSIAHKRGKREREGGGGSGPCATLHKGWQENFWTLPTTFHFFLLAWSFILINIALKFYSLDVLTFDQNYSRSALWGCTDVSIILDCCYWSGTILADKQTRLFFPVETAAVYFVLAPGAPS